MENKPKYGNKEKAKAIELYHRLRSFKAVCELTGIARSTLRRWVSEFGDANMVGGKKADTCTDCNMPADEKEGFGVVRSAMLQLLWRKIQTAINSQNALEKLLEAVTEDEDTPQKERLEPAKALVKMARPEMKELTYALMALCDKQTQENSERIPDLSHLSTEEIRMLLEEEG